jgi:hypothetical protein
MATNGATPPSRNAMTAPIGRPSSYTPELADLICERLADGRTLRDVCRDEDMPTESTVRTWANDDREGFYAQYARAREIGYHAMADETLEIADDGRNDWVRRQDENGETYVLNGEHVQRSRLRVDTRKWLLSKALPKLYGDKIIQEVTGADGAPLVPIINLTGRPEPSSAS